MFEKYTEFVITKNHVVCYHFQSPISKIKNIVDSFSP